MFVTESLIQHLAARVVRIVCVCVLRTFPCEDRLRRLHTRAVRRLLSSVNITSVKCPAWSDVTGCGGECRIAAGFGACERIKHLHVCVECVIVPFKRSLQSAGSVSPSAVSGNLHSGARSRSDTSRLSFLCIFFFFFVKELQCRITWTIRRDRLHQI